MYILVDTMVAIFMRKVKNVFFRMMGNMPTFSSDTSKYCFQCKLMGRKKSLRGSGLDLRW